MMVGWRSVILVNMITELWMMMMIVTIDYGPNGTD